VLLHLIRNQESTSPAREAVLQAPIAGAARPDTGASDDHHRYYKCYQVELQVCTVGDTSDLGQSCKRRMSMLQDPTAELQAANVETTNHRRRAVMQTAITGATNVLCRSCRQRSSMLQEPTAELQEANVKAANDHHRSYEWPSLVLQASDSVKLQRRLLRRRT
jgi:hypothetical protein